MKKITFFVFLLFTIMLSAYQLSTEERIKKYSGKNSNDLLGLRETQIGDTLTYVNFLLDNCSANDLSILTSSTLMKNVRFAIKTKDIEYSKLYDEDIFKHFVLPHRVSQEPLEDWRELFFTKLLPIIEDAETIEEAAVLVNLWSLEQMSFKSTHGRDQGPITTMKRGFGRCEETMIFVIAALRSVGIPARPASAPYWNFTNSNHAWIEIWTPTGWQYTGEPENSLNKAWFSKTTERSTLIQSQAFGNYNSPNTMKQKNNATTISSIEYYTDYNDCKIYVLENNKPLADVNVFLYATSFGGLFPLAEIKTDKNGIANIQLGKGAVWAVAYNDNKIAYKLFDLMNETAITLNLEENKDIDEYFTFHFPIPNSSSNSKEKKEILGDKFYLMRENYNLKRKERLNSQKQADKFVKYYNIMNSNDNKDFDLNREEFLTKCNELGANSDDFLFVFTAISDDINQKVLVNMIEKWDIKELCEIPDSTMIKQVVDIYSKVKQQYKEVIPDSIFYDNVIGFTWRSGTPCQNGWQPELYSKLEHLQANSPKKTTKNILKWINKNSSIDDNYVWNYFSGSLNPIDILNMKNIPEYYKMKLINSSLKTMGIPVRWKGRLEYFDGEEFVEVPLKTKDNEKIDDFSTSIKISIFVDDIQIKADPYGNFLLASLDTKTGAISNTYFDGEADSLSFMANYRTTGEDYKYIEAFVRNGNGDANIRVKRINNDDEIKIFLETPQEYLNKSDNWSDETLQNCQEQLKSISNCDYKLLFVRGKTGNEPEVRMLNQLIDKQENFKTKNCKFIIYSEERSNSDLSYKNVTYKTGNKFITEDIPDENYPIIFIFDSNNQLLFSTTGYNMGIPKLLLDKLN